jgi:hypothetical protein
MAASSVSVSGRIEDALCNFEQFVFQEMPGRRFLRIEDLPIVGEQWCRVFFFGCRIHSRSTSSFRRRVRVVGDDGARVGVHHMREA